MAINVFDSFLREFEQPITAFVSTSVSNLASYIDGPLRTAVMLYVILYGFAVMRGAISEPIMEFAWRAMRIVVVVLLATNSSAISAIRHRSILRFFAKGDRQCVSGVGTEHQFRSSFRSTSLQRNRRRQQDL